MRKFIEQSIISSSEIIRDSVLLSENVEIAINKICESLKNDGKIVLFGNGGSEADAQHIAAEFIGRFQIERKSYPAIALTTDTSIITALSNDYSNDVVFSRQCESLVKSGDIIIGISTSGNSKNVESGIKISKQKGAYTIGLLGNDGGKIKDIVDLAIVVNSSSTAKIQEVHRVIYHIICNIVESELQK